RGYVPDRDVAPDRVVLLGGVAEPLQPHPPAVLDMGAALRCGHLVERGPDAFVAHPCLRSRDWERASCHGFDSPFKFGVGLVRRGGQARVSRSRLPTVSVPRASNRAATTRNSCAVTIASSRASCGLATGTP